MTTFRTSTPISRFPTRWSQSSAADIYFEEFLASGSAGGASASQARLSFGAPPDSRWRRAALTIAPPMSSIASVKSRSPPALSPSGAPLAPENRPKPRFGLQFAPAPAPVRRAIARARPAGPLWRRRPKAMSLTALRRAARASRRSPERAAPRTKIQARRIAPLQSKQHAQSSLRHAGTVAAGRFRGQGFRASLRASHGRRRMEPPPRPPSALRLQHRARRAERAGLCVMAGPAGG